ncbi:MAG: SPASM domain-containing protein [Candidatus Omnitrophica bacterium]|nr:SPASM domain-containing protein [Candidatus Omnitrophota bacterium]
MDSRQERVRILKEEIVASAQRRVTQNTTDFSAREKNLLFNDFEYNVGKIHLESTPEGVGLGAHYNCNAQCVFCLGGKPKIFTLQRYKEFFEPRLGRLLSRARYANFCGFGELLLLPEVEDFLDYVNHSIPEVNKIYTTNGTPLLNKGVFDRVTQSKVALEVSLHASSAQLHKVLTRLNIFNEITLKIKQLVSARKNSTAPYLVLVFLANTLNIEDLPNFIKLAASLGVDEVACNYMNIFHYSQIKLSCFFKQEITVSAFKKAQQVAHKLKMPLRLPPYFGQQPLQNLPRICSDPWKYFYVENEGSVLPCCFAGDHVGYLGEVDFETIWNGFHYRNLRKSLINDVPGEWCKYCYKYRSENVNDIRAHINFKPGFRDKILKGIKL